MQHERIDTTVTTRTASAKPASSSTSPADGRRPEYPSVGVVIATHDRPQLMRRALNSILCQEYPGRLEVAVVFDRSEPDMEDQTARGQRIRVLVNSRTPGLAGARNTGILAVGTELVAFCDDDDEWLPGKLQQQVNRLLEHPEAQFVTTAMLVDYQGHETVRLAGTERVTLTDLSRSRMAMLHSSSFLFRRRAMLDGFGLVDEAVPESMAEDWDLLLRASRQRPIEHVDEPLVRIQWGASSYFNDAWRTKIRAHRWLLDQHPELSSDSRAAALQNAKLAFGYAAIRQRRAALWHARDSLRRNWREPRAYLALAVTAGVSGQWIQQTLNRHGHGI